MDPDLYEALVERMSWGYSMEELQDMLARGGMGSAGAASAASYLDQLFGQAFGPMPGGMTGTTPAMWRYTQRSKQARMFGAYHLGPGEEKPGTRGWGELEQRIGAVSPMITRQGARSFYQAEQVALSGYWLRGEQPGTVSVPIGEEKLAKRGQMLGAHEIVHPYSQLGESLMRRAPLRAERAFAREPGVVLRAAVPLSEVLPSGMGMLGENVFGSLRQRIVRDIPLAEGFEPTGLPQAGQTWNIAAGQRPVPFEGAAGLSMGAWEQAQLIGEPQRLSRQFALPPEEGGGTATEEYMRYVFERSMSPTYDILSAKTGLSKATIPVGDIGALTGREDIQAILPLKEPLGLAWSWAMGQPREQLAGRLGMTEQELAGKTWQDVGPQLVGQFREQMLRPTSEGGLLETMTIGGRETQALVGDFFTATRREYPFRRPKVPYRELERYRRTSPELYESIMRESAPLRSAYGGILQAAGATSGELGVPAGTVSPTTYGLQAVVRQAEAAAMEVTGAKTIGEVPEDIFSRHVMLQARRAWGQSTLEVGEGQYLASPAAAARFRAQGAMAGSEASAWGRRYAGALVGMAGRETMPQEAQKAVRTAIEKQEELASGRHFVRNALSAYLPRTAFGGVYAASEKLRPSEWYARPEQVMRGYGIRPEERASFMESWRQGQIMPTSVGIRFPAQGDEPITAGFEMLHPEQLAERGVTLSPELQQIGSVAGIQSMAGDVDADTALRKLTGRVQRTGDPNWPFRIEHGILPSKDSEIMELAELAEKRGAQSLFGEMGKTTSMQELREKLTPGGEGWQTYTMSQVQEAYRKDLALREKIGPSFNIMEQVALAGHRVGTEYGQAAESLFASVYGRMQRPEELPPHLAQITGALQTGSISTGQYLAGEKWQRLGGGFEGLGTGLVQTALGLLGEGQTAEEVAALVSTPESYRLNLQRIQEVERYGGSSEGALLAGQVSAQIGWDPKEFIKSPLGAVGLPLGYRRAKRHAEREGLTGRAAELQETERRILAGLQMPGQQGLYKALTGGVERIESHQAMLTKRPDVGLGEKLEAIRKAAPHMYRELGLEAATPANRPPPRPTRPRQEARVPLPSAQTAAISGAYEGPMEYEKEDWITGALGAQADLPSAGGVRPATGGRVVPPAPTAPAGMVEGSPEWMDWAFGGQADIPAGGGTPIPEMRHTGAAGPAGAATSYVPVEGMDWGAYEGAAPWHGGGRGGGGGVAGGAGGIGGGGTGTAVPPTAPRPGGGGGGGQEGMQRFISGLIGVSGKDFQKAVSGMAVALDAWRDQVKEAMEAGEPLPKNLKQFNTQLDKWQNVIEKAVMQRGVYDRPEQYWGARGMQATLATAGILQARPAYGQFQELQQQSQIRETMALLGGDGDGGRGGFLGTPVGAGLGRLAGIPFRGWEMMRLARMWNMTGGRVMQQIPVAAQQEQGAMQAGLAGMPMGQGQLGGMTMDLMSLQARQQWFAGDVGRAAFQSYGWAQQTLGPGAATAAGIWGPAAGVGMLGGSLAYMGMHAGALASGLTGAAATSAAMGPAIGIGLGVTGAVGLAGMASYAGEFVGDRERMAMAAAGGGRWWERAIQRAHVRDPRFRGELPSVEYGQQLMSGDLTGLSAQGRAAAVQYATREYAPEWMAPQQAMAAAQQWMAYTPGAQNIQQIYQTPAFEQMAMRGMTPSQFAQTGQQFGMAPGDWQKVMYQQLGVTEATARQQEWVAGQWAPAMNWGVSGERLREMAYGQLSGEQQQQYRGSFLAGGQVPSQAMLPQMTTMEQGRFASLMGGNRLAATMFATGQLPFSSPVSQYMREELGIQPAPWQITMEPTTGLPLHTTTAQYYGGGAGALETGAAAGGLRGIQWAQAGLQEQAAQNQWANQQRTFQMNYMAQTGQTMPGLAGAGFSPGLTAQLQGVGGMWGLQEQMIGTQYANQMTNFGFQQRAMGLQREQFMENWDVRFGRLGIQSEREETGFQRNLQRQAIQDEQWMSRWNRQQAQGALQFGWQMEDFGESIRFATGRQKLRLMRERERATISESMRRGGAEEDLDYWERLKALRDEDLEDAEEAMDQQREWREADMLRQKEHFEETAALQDERLSAQISQYQEMHDLQEEQRKLQQQIWKEQQKNTAEYMTAQNAIAEQQREYSRDVMRLQQDAVEKAAMFAKILLTMESPMESIAGSAERIAGRGESEPGTTRRDTVEGWGFERETEDVYTIPIPGEMEEGTYGEWQGYQRGGAVRGAAGSAVKAIVHAGEYVVPQGGSLVQRDDRVVDVLEQILEALERGNGRFEIIVNNPEPVLRETSRLATAAYSV